MLRLTKNLFRRPCSVTTPPVDKEDGIPYFPGEPHFMGHHHPWWRYSKPDVHNSSTSPTISGSSAEVGSSNKSTSGSIAIARAMAARWLLTTGQATGILVGLVRQSHGIEQLHSFFLRSGSVIFSALPGPR